MKQRKQQFIMKRTKPLKAEIAKLLNEANKLCAKAEKLKGDEKAKKLLDEASKLSDKALTKALKLSLRPPPKAGVDPRLMPFLHEVGVLLANAVQADREREAANKQKRRRSK